MGNKARTRRLVQLADALLRYPGGSLPQKIEDPMALQALYRLMQRREVTHASVLAPHQAETLRRIEEHEGPLLAISDATELDYSGLTSLQQLGQIGNGNARGYVCQNVLIVDPQQRSVVGLANQILHTRGESPSRETHRERCLRESRESRLWPRHTSTSVKDRARLLAAPTKVLRTIRTLRSLQNHRGSALVENLAKLKHSRWGVA